MSAAQATRRAAVLGGRTGLLGQSLHAALTDAGWHSLALSRADVDPFDESALARFLDEHGVEVVFNTIAYTQVDAAEDDEREAYRLNRDLPALLARLAARQKLGLVHFSTDFVFDGTADTPYAEDHPTNPQSVYGASKLAGEKAIRQAKLDQALIIRTSWLFGPGKTNFVQKILGFAAQREVLTVVHDQVGSPTATPDLARGAVLLAQQGHTGTFHLANAGRASWCELAAEAVHLAGLPCVVQPITSGEFPQKAKRPGFSVLDLSKFREHTGASPRPWAQALREYVQTLDAAPADGLAARESRTGKDAPPA